MLPDEKRAVSQVIDKTNEESFSTPHDHQNKKSGPSEYKFKIIWWMVISFVILHVITIIELYKFLFTTSWNMRFYNLWLVYFSGMGVTAGAHRLWSHKSYKAKTPLRLLLVICNSTASMFPVYDFVKYHRIHHAYTDTDADPHNSARGFFFSHIGWLCTRRHPEVKAKWKTIDMSDLDADWVVMWQKKYEHIIIPLCAFIIPSLIPVYFGAMEFIPAFKMCGIARWLLTLHGAFFVNSAAHIWGFKPFDSSSSARENPYVSFWAFGEGWHNYHHTFPWDYKTSEFPGYNLNLSTAFIDFFAWVGWAYDLKTVKQDMIHKRALRTGDGTFQMETKAGECQPTHQDDKNGIWGWDDKDLTNEQKSVAKVT